MVKEPPVKPLAFELVFVNTVWALKILRTRGRQCFKCPQVHFSRGLKCARAWVFKVRVIDNREKYYGQDRCIEILT
jgi:hypothetical protein